MQKGELIAERFELEAQVASGGMGSIFRAFDRRTGVPVALKAWPPNFTTSGGAAGRAKARSLQRFEREAAALAAIAHPAVVRYVAHGLTGTGDPFLVMDWVAGCNLAEKLQSSGMSVAETLRLAERLLSALVALHASGVVHRDLKPANVMLESGQAGRAMLVDFGIARDAKAIVLTRRGAQLGTPCYTSPEQIRDPRAVDGRADVFALGCIAFECLAKVRAFQGDDILATLAQVLLEGAPDLSRLRPDLPAPIVRWVMDLLASDRELRPSAEAALERVTRLLAESDLSQFDTPTLEFGMSTPTTTLAHSVRETVEAWSTDTLAVDSSQGSATRRFDDDERTRPLIARETELAQLADAVAGNRPLISLWGPPGIGKTRLARELWRQTSLTDRSQCLWVDLSSTNDRTSALRLLSGGVGAHFSATETAAATIGRALASAGGTLAVLDGVDALLPELPAIIAQSQRSAPQLTVIATSRARLSLPGALTLELGPLATHRARAVDGSASAQPSPSARLFVLHAETLGVRFPLSEPPSATVERIVQELEGIPLAIELAAARVPSLGVEGVLALCARTPEGASGAAGHVSTERDALQGALRSAWISLTPVERKVLGACAVFRGSFSTEFAARVSGLDRQPAHALSTLQALHEKSMLRAASDRFCMFSVVREFALAELSLSGELENVRFRHAALAGERAAALAPLPDERELEFTRRVEAESDDLFTAVEYALSPAVLDLPLALHLLGALEPVIVARGPLPAILELIDRAIGGAEQRGGQEGSTPLARVLVMRARSRSTSGRFREASADLDAAEQLARAAANSRVTASICLERGLIHHFQRDLRSARETYQEAVSLLRGSSDLRSLGRCYGNLGAVFHDNGKLIEATAYYWKAIQTLDALGDTRLLANFLGNLALLEQELGALPSARRRYERAITLLQHLGDVRLRAIMLGNLGSLEAELGNWHSARDCHEQALTFLRPLDDRRSLALCQARLSAALAMLGQLGPANDELARAQQLAGTDDLLLREEVGIFQAFLGLASADAARRQGDRQSAHSHLERVEAACRRVRRERSDGRSLSRISDDIRTALRSIAPLVRDLQAALDERRDQA
ncbi:MAG TPA: protein kinase [Polyangiaceae bacterium]|nr:protein kinase [Polyangiaceae bacterium]